MLVPVILSWVLDLYSIKLHKSLLESSNSPLRKGDLGVEQKMARSFGWKWCSGHGDVVHKNVPLRQSDHPAYLQPFVSSQTKRWMCGCASTSFLRADTLHPLWCWHEKVSMIMTVSDSTTLWVQVISGVTVCLLWPGSADHPMWKHTSTLRLGQ